MNALFKLRRGLHITKEIPLHYIVYMALLSNVKMREDNSVVYAGDYDDLYDYFSDWDNEDEELYNAFNRLIKEGLIYFEEKVVVVGAMNGRKFTTFESDVSIGDNALKLLNEAIDSYGNSKSAKDRSRARHIREKVDSILAVGIDRLRPSDLTNLHSYVYEIYTGGETYIIRNKVEYFQMNNVLKAYESANAFAILITGVLKYDSFRKSGIPTLINVASMKDDIFAYLTKPKDTKEYMRETKDDGDF